MRKRTTKKRKKEKKAPARVIPHGGGLDAGVCLSPPSPWRFASRVFLVCGVARAHGDRCVPWWRALTSPFNTPAVVVLFPLVGRGALRPTWSHTAGGLPVAGGGECPDSIGPLWHQPGGVREPGHCHGGTDVRAPGVACTEAAEPGEDSSAPAGHERPGSPPRAYLAPPRGGSGAA